MSQGDRQAGSHTPASRRLAVAAIVLAAAFAAFALAVLASAAAEAAAAEAPTQLWSRCPSGSAGGQCLIARGVGADPSAPGDVYVADQANRRIDELSAWGSFVRAWGWDVVASGPDETGTGFEVCEAAQGDVCQAGSEGGGEGQLSIPQGVAVDAEGDVFVVDKNNLRVQEFGSEGQFLEMFGGEVNKTKTDEAAPEAQRNRCPVDPGDECQAGSAGAGNGQFSWSSVGSFIAAGPGDTIYVGDTNRIEEFDAAGEYEGEIALPVSGQPASLVADPGTGALYLAYPVSFGVQERSAQPSVYRYEGGKWSAFAEIDRPEVLALDGAGDLYAFDAKFTGPGGPDDPTSHSSRILEYSPAGKQIGLFAEGEIGESTGLAAGGACLGAGAHDLYISSSDSHESFVRAYGPPPTDPGCPPPPAAPSISSQYAASVGTAQATVRAQINPHFWSGSIGETEYFVQYATAACVPGREDPEEEDWEVPCVKQQPAPPARLAGGALDQPLTTGGVLLAGLAPGTEYRYRFAAESRDAEGEPVVGGQPVYGVGGTPGKAGTAQSFTTFPTPGPEGGCANEALRGGPSAALPDCRAYELVSPVDKEGGDVEAPPLARLDQAAPEGEKITYTSQSAFAGARSAPYYSQYLATRTSAGWHTEALAPVQEGPLFNFEVSVIESPFAAFTPDLSEAMQLTASEPLLAPGGTAGYDNLYRHRLGGGYEACGPLGRPPHEALELFYPETQGFSEEGPHRGVFVAGDQLQSTPAAAPELPGEGRTNGQLYLCEGGELHLLSVLPDGVASGASNTAGTANEFTLARLATLAGAVSADGSRAYWTATAGKGLGGPGALYVRTNDTATESAREHGAASGSGDLIGPAHGRGKTHNGQTAIGAVKATSGGFAVGQEIADEKGGEVIAAGTKIETIEFEKEEGGTKLYKLTLSKAAKKTVLSEGTQVGAALVGLPSDIALNAQAKSGAFEPGQEISAPSLPIGTRIEAVEETAAGVFKLTLSAAPGATEADGAVVAGAAKATAASLGAAGPCTEAATKACTIALTGDGTVFGSTDAHFFAANREGSEALFSEGEPAAGKATLYRFELAGAEEGKAPQRIAGEVFGVLGQSADLSRVYLLSGERIGGAGEAGAPNLYLYEAGAEGAEGAFTFVATLSGRDTSQSQGEGNYSPVNPRPAFHTARATPGGGTLAFMSNSGPLAEAVAGYDITDASSPAPCGSEGGICDAEIYLYEAGSGELVCVSCNRGGARPAGREFGGEGSQQLFAPSLLPAWQTSLYAGNPLSEHGNRLFFDSFERLTLGDTNGAADVYEWERAGTGSCREGRPSFEPRAGGCLALISSGQSPDDSEFIDATPEGSNAFFTTSASLVGSDPGSIDLYDAREGGGFPEAEGAAGCEGEACQSPPEAPNHPTPATSVLAGEGNVEEAASKKPRCKKGKVKKHGKCVAKKHKRKPHQKAHKRHASHNRGAGK